VIKQRLLQLERRQKRALQIVSDIFLISLSTTVAIWLQAVSSERWVDYQWLYLAMPLISLPVFIRMGMYRAVMRYFGNEALLAIVKAVSVSVAILWLVGNPLQTSWSPLSAQLTLLIWLLNIVSIGGLRLVMRHYFMGDWYFGGEKGSFISHPPNTGQAVAIYGAGAAGNQLLTALRMGRDMRPVAFIDDDPGIVNRVIAGLPVYSPEDMGRLINDTGAGQILLAVPSASRSRRREILGYLESFSVHVRSVPGFMDLASGRVKVSDIQEVDVGDLLGRDSVPANETLLHRCIDGKSVMVSGAGGSIGSELCRQILELGPKTLVLYEHSEYNLYSIYEELRQLAMRRSLNVNIVPVLGSIRRYSRLNNVLARWGVNTVYHAAAYKHVPLVEQNIAEGILNNVIGTLNLARSAIENGVANFVLVSTDKAVRPTNVMGASKRLAEMILQALSREPSIENPAKSGATQINRTQFTMVRFGNVLGSSGSVIPRFREQILHGGPVTVTHPNITRYFMTIPEAAQLVIQAGSMGRGGDVFLLDMGEPVRILDLAKKMIHLSGVTVKDQDNPNGDIAIEFTGLRPGEKLYEELLIGADSEPTDHAMIMRAREEYLPWDALQLVINGLLEQVEEDDYASVRKLLRETVQGYVPEKEIVDLVYTQRSSS
jgi:UDP-N-acetylglucosamine 4,6-dehydratase